MSMEINGNYSRYQADYAQQLRAEQEKVKESEKGQKEMNASDKAPAGQDAYISSEKSGKQPSGLYRVGQDENGRRKVFYDDPKKSARADGEKQAQAEPAAGPADPKKPVEMCVADTDQVDREIKQLKEKVQQLKQQIQSASEDEEKVRDLEKKLAQAEGELRQKDNDTYRKQHASVSKYTG